MSIMSEGGLRTHVGHNGEARRFRGDGLLGVQKRRQWWRSAGSDNGLGTVCMDNGVVAGSSTSIA